MVGVVGVAVLWEVGVVFDVVGWVEWLCVGEAVGVGW